MLLSYSVLRALSFGAFSDPSYGVLRGRLVLLVLVCIALLAFMHLELLVWGARTAHIRCQCRKQQSNTVTDV